MIKVINGIAISICTSLIVYGFMYPKDFVACMFALMCMYVLHAIVLYLLDRY